MKTDSQRPFGHLVQYAGLSIISGVLCALPHDWALHAGDFLGRLAFRFWPLRREVADENLRQALPHLSAADRRLTLSRLYRHLGRTLAEFCRYPVLSPRLLSKRIQIEGESHLRQALAAGRGVFLLTSHFGNWEFLGAGLAARGFPMTYMVGPHRNKLAEEMFNRYRALNNVEVLTTDTDLRGVFRALRAGRIVATVADQDAGPEGYFLDFFGRPASAALGPFRIARRTGAPLVVALIERRGGRHHASIDPPFFSDPQVDAEEEAIAWARRYHARLEAAISKHPEQWFWVHRRWRTPQPDGAEG